MLPESEWKLLTNELYEGPAGKNHRVAFAPFSLIKDQRRCVYIHTTGRPALVGGTTKVAAEDNNLRVHPGDCAAPTKFGGFGVDYYELAGAVEYVKSAPTRQQLSIRSFFPAIMDSYFCDVTSTEVCGDVLSVHIHAHGDHSTGGLQNYSESSCWFVEVEHEMYEDAEGYVSMACPRSSPECCGRMPRVAPMMVAQ